MISPYAIYLTFPVAVHLSSRRQKHDRRGEETSKRFCQTEEYGFPAPLPEGYFQEDARFCNAQIY